MIRIVKKSIRLLKRWIKKQRTLRYSHSTAFTLITKPLWQHDRIKALIGAPLVAAFVFSANPSPAATNDLLTGWDISKPVSQISGFSTELKTDHTYFLPVVNLTGISQYFHAGHPGVDFRSPLGDDVVAIDDGEIAEITESAYGYGRHVYVRHSNGMVSLYAHLGLIMVETGELIKAGAKVGEIGMTGWSTGPHLHFELSQNGSKMNPIPLLSKALSLRFTK